MDKWTDCLEYRGQIDVMYSDFEKTRQDNSEQDV